MRRGNASDAKASSFEVGSGSYACHGSNDLESVFTCPLLYCLQQEMTDSLMLNFGRHGKMGNIPHLVLFFVQLGNADHFSAVIDRHKVFADRFVIILLCPLGMPPGFMQNFVTECIICFEVVSRLRCFDCVHVPSSLSRPWTQMI